MTEVSASDPHGANAQFLDWINHSACQQQTGHGCHQETGHEQYYGEKNRTVERRVGLAFGQFDEHQPTEWRNLRVRSEHRMTEDIFSIGSLKHRRIETVTSKLDLSELRDIGVTKDQGHITMGNDARSFVDKIHLAVLPDIYLRDNVPNQFEIDLHDGHTGIAASVSHRQDHVRLAFAKIDRPVIDLVR